MSGPSQRIRADLRRADAWVAMDPCQRTVESLDNYDEFGFFWHRISDLVERYAEIGPPARRITGGTLVAMIARTARLRGERDEMQGLHRGGGDDRPAYEVSGAAMRHTPSTSREWPPRSQPRPTSPKRVRAS